MIYCPYANPPNQQTPTHPTSSPTPLRHLGIRLRPRPLRPTAHSATRARPNANPTARAYPTHANRPPIIHPNANPAAFSLATRPLISDRMRII